ncbi:glycosyltransferase [Corynebacterium callunae]|uniref:Glycosyltransferase n=1 Tax=Corynebacterium callunae DSM 20147 TaxID=1121353 RepID=M1UX76_9CORY|nr:glycosyltransferase [Corynebacterium callunae]AGG65773.1 glycosyltransferase [Corynebacterium callunae DSM 20147]
MTKVSVVSGFYNRKDFLERTISSILNQTFEDFELIVFDDCSMDGTKDELEKLKVQFSDDRFSFVIHENNKGFVKGLIDAIEISTGEFIAIQGSGDISLPERLQKQVDFLEDNPDVGAVGGWLYNIEENGSGRSLHEPKPGKLSFKDLENTDPPFTHGEVMFRRRDYEAAGKYREGFKYAQDYDLWYRIAKRSKLAVIPSVIYHRFTLLDGVSFVPSKTVLQKCYAMAAKRLSTLPEDEEKRAYRRLVVEGPTAVVPIADAEVQSFIPKAAIRLCVFGNAQEARKMSNQYIVNSTTRYLTNLAIIVLSTRVTKPIGIALFGKLISIKKTLSK